MLIVFDATSSPQFNETSKKKVEQILKIFEKNKQVFDNKKLTELLKKSQNSSSQQQFIQEIDKLNDVIDQMNLVLKSK